MEPPSLEAVREVREGWGTAFLCCSLNLPGASGWTTILLDTRQAEAFFLIRWDSSLCASSNVPVQMWCRGCHLLNFLGVSSSLWGGRITPWWFRSKSPQTQKKNGSQVMIHSKLDIQWRSDYPTLVIRHACYMATEQCVASWGVRHESLPFCCLMWATGGLGFSHPAPLCSEEEEEEIPQSLLPVLLHQHLGKDWHNWLGRALMRSAESCLRHPD